MKDKLFPLSVDGSKLHVSMTVCSAPERNDVALDMSAEVTKFLLSRLHALVVAGKKFEPSSPRVSFLIFGV